MKIQNPESAKNSNIRDISKLITLTSIGYDLFLNNNYNLTDFKGLDNISEIGRDLKIQWNENITSIEGLNGTIAINRNLDIHSNPKLRNLNALNKLKTVKGNLNIQSNGTYQYSLGIIDFCGITNLITNNGLLGSYTVANNKGINPTKDDIKNGNCKN